MRELLYQGISLIIIDIVTNRPANLHPDLIYLMDTTPMRSFPDEVNLYAVAYCPVLRQERAEIGIWPATCALGTLLPCLPLCLMGTSSFRSILRRVITRPAIANSSSNNRGHHAERSTMSPPVRL